MEGKTEKAKTDLARLAKIRADREAAAAKREALKKEAEGMGYLYFLFVLPLKCSPS